MAAPDEKLLADIEGSEVHYIKSKDFRVIYAEGAWGGPSPHGMIAFSLYNERPPIPIKGVLHEGRTAR
jgi:hypothetical protein